MSKRNERVVAMLAANAPAARDLAFEIAVLARIEQRRFRRSLCFNLAVAAVAAALLALVMPRLDLDFSGWSSTLSRLTGSTLVTVTLLIAVFVAWRYRPGARLE